MKVVIIRYNAGNIKSVEYALNRLGVQPLVSGEKEEIISADKVIFPGVGEASSTMKYLREQGLDKVIKGLRQPVLGVCLGMQLMCSYSEEGDTDCLGIFDCKVQRFPQELKVPHMGWNELKNLKGKLFNGLNDGDHAYFVHSYFAPVTADTVAECDYGFPFSAALQKDNFYAVQFHPEKSVEVGERVLGNFLSFDET